VQAIKYRDDMLISTATIQVVNLALNSE